MGAATEVPQFHVFHLQMGKFSIHKYYYTF